jgi:hypothetical protein
VALAVSLSSVAVTSLAARPVDAQRKFHTLAAGLERVRAKRLPAIVLYQRSVASGLVAPTAPTVEPPFFSPILNDSRFRKVLRQYVLIRVEDPDLLKPYPLPAGAAAKPGASSLAETIRVGAVLDLDGDRGTALVLDLRERIVVRYEDRKGKPPRGAVGEGEPRQLPRPSQLRRELSRIWKVNQLFAKEAARVEPLLEQALYSFRAGEPRAGVLVLRDLEGAKAQRKMDPVLRARVDEAAAEMRAKAQEAMVKADRLDRQRQYFKALDVLDAVLAEFPFKDVAQHATRRQGEILRKLTIGR